MCGLGVVRVNSVFHGIKDRYSVGMLGVSGTLVISFKRPQVYRQKQVFSFVCYSVVDEEPCDR